MSPEEKDPTAPKAAGEAPVEPTGPADEATEAPDAVAGRGGSWTAPPNKTEASEPTAEPNGDESAAPAEQDPVNEGAAASEEAVEPESAAPPAAEDVSEPAAQDVAEDQTQAPNPAPESIPAQSEGGGEPPQPPAAATGTPPAASEPPADESEEEEPAAMTFMDHLQELRVRLTRCAIAVLVGFLACYGFSKQLFELLMQPLVSVIPPESHLIFTALPEAFFTYIKVAFVAGMLLTSPYIFYQIWCFVAPGLYEEERKSLIPVGLFSGIFFVTGAWFGYAVVFPFAFEFFMSFATETIRPLPSLNEYLGFSLKLLFAFGFVFELPLFIFFLAKLGLVTAAKLRKVRKYAFLCSFIVAAILTPPDVVSQTLMAGPLIILYEIGIWVAAAFGKKPKAEPEPENSEQSPEGGDTASAADSKD